jgi:hypothetical protein
MLTHLVTIQKKPVRQWQREQSGRLLQRYRLCTTVAQYAPQISSHSQNTERHPLHLSSSFRVESENLCSAYNKYHWAKLFSLRLRLPATPRNTPRDCHLTIRLNSTLQEKMRAPRRQSPKTSDPSALGLGASFRLPWSLKSRS